MLLAWWKILPDGLLLLSDLYNALGLMGGPQKPFGGASKSGSEPL